MWPASPLQQASRRCRRSGLQEEPENGNGVQCGLRSYGRERTRKVGAMSAHTIVFAPALQRLRSSARASQPCHERLGGCCGTDHAHLLCTSAHHHKRPRQQMPGGSNRTTQCEPLPQSLPGATKNAPTTTAERSPSAPNTPTHNDPTRLGNRHGGRKNTTKLAARADIKPNRQAGP